MAGSTIEVLPLMKPSYEETISFSNLSDESSVNGSLGLSSFSELYGAPFWTQFRLIFYLMSPQEVSFKNIEICPDYLAQTMPLVLLICVLEWLGQKVFGNEDEHTLDTHIVNVTSSAVQDAFYKFVFRGVELMAYIYLYENYRFFTLHWDAASTFFLAMMFVDYALYWHHRASHEVGFLWPAHEFHHSSEDFNTSVAVRLSYHIRFYKWLFLAPLAVFGIPASVMSVHNQIGAIYNVNCHFSFVPPLGTVVPGLGDLYEYIFMTPTHHKVHHAMNKYAIDKNYGNLFVLWDRLHGTFVDYRPEEKLSFGSITPNSSTSSTTLMNEPYVKFLEKVGSMETFGDKVRAFFYGPGWFPGTPRLGSIEDLPDMRGRPKWLTSHPWWLKSYVVVNGAAVFLTYVDIGLRMESLSTGFHALSFAYIYGSYWSLGSLYDSMLRGVAGELLRSLVLLLSVFCTSVPLVAGALVRNYCLLLSVSNIALLPLLAVYVHRVKSAPLSEKEAYQTKMDQFMKSKESKLD